MSTDPRIVFAAQLDAKVLAHITNHIGKYAPMKREMADLFRTNIGRVGHSIDRLKARGVLQVSGCGMAFQFHVIGKGETIKRIGRDGPPVRRFAEGDVRSISPDDVMARRQERRVCFRREGKIVNDEHVGVCAVRRAA